MMSWVKAALAASAVASALALPAAAAGRGVARPIVVRRTLVQNVYVERIVDKHVYDVKPRFAEGPRGTFVVPRGNLPPGSGALYKGGYYGGDIPGGYRPGYLGPGTWHAGYGAGSWHLGTGPGLRPERSFAVATPRRGAGFAAGRTTIGVAPVPQMPRAYPVATAVGPNGLDDRDVVYDAAGTAYVSRTTYCRSVGPCGY